MKWHKAYGILLTLILSAAVFIALFGTYPIFHLKTNMFGAGGDIQKDIYNTYWNAKYDHSVRHCGSMNYPYGEETTYTGCQTFVSAPLQWLRRAGIGDFSDYTLLLMNLVLVVSILLCPLFLYLIFHELKVPEWLAIVASVTITFFSPQMGRVGAHLTLAYLFILPCALYLFYQWWITRRTRYCVWIALLAFFAMLAHPYYVVFIGAVWAMTWLYLLFTRKMGGVQVWKSICQCLLQMVVPMALFGLLVQTGGDGGVRALLPTGFYKFGGSLLGVFWPNGRYGLPFLSGWEGHVWIGWLALAIFVVGLVKTVAKIFRRKWNEWLRVTDNEFLNLMFWTSVIVLLFSFGIPLLWFPLRFLAHLGPLGQLRALGRFGWLFFFVMNIIAVYAASKYIQNLQLGKKISVSAFVAIALVADVVGIYTLYWFRWAAIHPSPIFSDVDNQSVENQWVDKIHSADYQSVLSLPYFSVGSEHLYLMVTDEDYGCAFYVSAKTGLPMHDLNASRSVITQVYDNWALTHPPYLPFAVLSDLPDQRPILLTTPTEGWRRHEEQQLLEYAQPLFSANGIDFYKMEIADFHRYESEFQKKMSRFADSCSLYETAPGIFCSDSAARFVLFPFDDTPTPTVFVGTGAAEHGVTFWEPVYDGCPGLSGTVAVSFLLSDYLDARSGYYQFRVQRFAPDGTEIYHDQSELNGYVSDVFNGWALVRYGIPAVAPTDRIVVSIRNRLRGKDAPVYIDNLLLQEEDVHVVNGDGIVRLLDNRPVR